MSLRDDDLAAIDRLIKAMRERGDDAHVLESYRVHCTRFASELQESMDSFDYATATRDTTKERF